MVYIIRSLSFILLLAMVISGVASGEGLMSFANSIVSHQTEEIIRTGELSGPQNVMVLPSGDIMVDLSKKNLFEQDYYYITTLSRIPGSNTIYANIEKHDVKNWFERLLTDIFAPTVYAPSDSDNPVTHYTTITYWDSKGLPHSSSVVNEPQKTSNALSSINSEQQGMGAPKLAPPSSEMSSSDTSSTTYSEASNAPNTAGNPQNGYVGNMYIWYIPAFEWHFDYWNPDHPGVPAAPMYFRNGKLNTIGYDWIDLPYSETGITHGADYDAATKAYVASYGGFNGVAAGVGPL